MTTERDILHPVFALVGLTLCVLALVGFRRIRATFAGKISGRDFAYGESQAVPPEVRLPNRNFMNLLETPVLFYVACILLYASRTIDQPALLLAWGFVALRFVHTAVHLTYNHVVHRLVLFAAGNVVLASLWVRLFFLLASTH